MEEVKNTTPEEVKETEEDKDLGKLTKAQLIALLKEQSSDASTALKEQSPAAPAAKETPEEHVARLRAKRPDTIRIKLIRDSGRYKSDVPVSVNGKSYLIQRGVEVELPYNVGMVLKRSLAQDEIASMLVDRLASQSRFDA